MVISFKEWIFSSLGGIQKAKWKFVLQLKICEFLQKNTDSWAGRLYETNHGGTYHCGITWSGKQAWYSSLCE